MVLSQIASKKNIDPFLTTLSYRDVFKREISIDNPIFLNERKCIRYRSCLSFNCFYISNIFCFCRNEGSIIEDAGPQVFLALFRQQYYSCYTIFFEERCSVELHNARMVQTPAKKMHYSFEFLSFVLQFRNDRRKP